MLQQKIADDLKTALKVGDQIAVATLRLVTAALVNRAIENRGRGLPEDSTDAAVIEVLQREVKKRQEAAALYRRGNRPELALREEQEAAVIERYLPAPVSRQEIEARVADILTRSRVTEFGPAMKAAMAELKGKADANLISELVREKLGGQ